MRRYGIYMISRFADVIYTDSITPLFCRLTEAGAAIAWDDCLQWWKTVQCVGIDGLYKQIDPYNVHIDHHMLCLFCHLVVPHSSQMF